MPIAGIAVGQVSQDRRTFAVGIDPVTGREIWRQEASPSQVTPGVEVAPVAIGDKVAYFRPNSEHGQLARLVIADPRTGNDLQVSGPQLFLSSPEPCSGNVDVCVLSHEKTDDEVKPHKFSPATGKYVAVTSKMPQDARTIGTAGLLGFDGRNPEEIGLLRDGRIRWTTKLGDAFPEGFSTDWGWSWLLYGKEKVYAGSVYGKPAEPYDQRRTEDLSTNRAMAAVSEDDGSVLWRDTGSVIGCNGIYGTDEDKTYFPVRCRYRGSETIDPDQKATFTFAGLEVTMEGFEVQTGRTTWSVPLGAAENLETFAKPFPVTGTNEIVVTPGNDIPLVIDADSGKSRTAAADATFWCLSSYKYDYIEPFTNRLGDTIHLRIGGNQATTCSATGNPATGTPSAAATSAVGAHIGPYVVMATDTGFTGYSVN
ncbi:hypothetical protein [Actinoplanes sp. NPDC020271]|uniref:hypothetical protein n=1 Tax=Actinoplanes sp. NPDC020271 TaxID=3363896 RepID=UPI00378AF4A7